MKEKTRIEETRLIEKDLGTVYGSLPEPNYSLLENRDLPEMIRIQALEKGIGSGEKTRFASATSRPRGLRFALVLGTILIGGVLLWSYNNRRIVEVENQSISNPLESWGQIENGPGIAFIAAPGAKIALVDSSHIRLRGGAAWADIRKRDQPFTVETQSGKITSKEATFLFRSEVGKSEIKVFAGSLSIHPRQSETTINLVAGQEITVFANRSIRASSLESLSQTADNAMEIFSDIGSKAARTARRFESAIIDNDPPAVK